MFLFSMVIKSTVIKLQCSILLCHMQNTFTKHPIGPFPCLDRNSRWLTMTLAKLSTSLGCNLSQWTSSNLLAPKHCHSRYWYVGEKIIYNVKNVSIHFYQQRHDSMLCSPVSPIYNFYQRTMNSRPCHNSIDTINLGATGW